MARKSTPPAVPGADSNQTDPSLAPSAPADAGGEAPGTAPAVTQGAPGAASGESNPVDLGANAALAPGHEPATAENGVSEPPAVSELVKALVLHDSIYGRCGEVLEFAADQVDALRGAGYIDPHPNAVASAGG